MKLDLVTLRAPVAWMGPGGKGDDAPAALGPGFLDLVALLLGSVTGFLDDLVLGGW